MEILCSIRARVGIGCLALVLVADGQDRVAVGLVAERVGTWTRGRDGKVLEVGDEVFQDTTVQTKTSTTSRIKISFFDDRPVWQRNCAQMLCNGGSYPLPESRDTPRGFPAFILNYASVRSRVPRIFTAARSLGTAGHGYESVLLADAGDDHSHTRNGRDSAWTTSRHVGQSVTDTRCWKLRCSQLAEGRRPLMEGWYAGHICSRRSK